MNEAATTPRPWWQHPGARLLLWLLVLAALLGVFTLYMRPGFARDLADLLWSCG